MTKTYRIAELNIRIASIHENVHRLCAEYLTEEGPVDLDIETTEEEIVEKLSERFEVPKERLREDVRQYLSALREKNLII